MCLSRTIRTYSLSANDRDQSIRIKYKKRSGKRKRSNAVPIRLQVVTYLMKNAPLSLTHCHLTLDLSLNHWNAAFILVKPNVGKIRTMNSKRRNVLVIMDLFSADRVQWSSASAVRATSTGISDASKRSIRDGKNSAKAFGKSF